MNFTMTATGGKRTDWRAERDRIDLAEVATRLLGPAPGRRGERSGRLWWNCPFHEDGNPSFCVKPGGKQWRCFGCGEKGDVIDLARRLNPAMTFPEAVEFLTGKPTPARPGISLSKPRNPRGREVSKVKLASDPAPDPDWQASASRIVADAAGRLWSPEGADALAYLKGRGLRDETIRSARLGVVTGGSRDLPAGITIPWGEGPSLSMVQVRRPEGSKPKYQALKGSRRGGVYPGPEFVRPGKPLIVVEGEFDALLLAQELGELAAVVTLGSASDRPAAATLGRMLDAWPRIVATDADGAGEKAAANWPASFRRVRPPEPDGDWTEAYQSRVRLRRWWSDALAGTDEPVKHTLAELLEWRWGEHPKQPGIVIDQPNFGKMVDALRSAALADDPEALAERLAIQEADA